jgi:hypothetical protein
MTWREVEERFGVTNESVDALSTLYARTEDA